MSERVSRIPPRKLYEMLRACPSSESRAQAALEFLRSCSRSPSGLLFLSRGGELVCAARSENAALTPELVASVRGVWDTRPNSQADDYKTMDASEIQSLNVIEASAIWTSDDGTSFERRLLSVYRDASWVSVGIVLLETAGAQALLPVSHVQVEALCNGLLDAGDVALAAPDLAR